MKSDGTKTIKTLDQKDYAPSSGRFPKIHLLWFSCSKQN